MGGRYGVLAALGDEAPIIGPRQATEPGGPMSNLIAGNGVNVVVGPAEVVGNLIGTDITGRAAIQGGPTQTGVKVGQGARLAANLISGNAMGGVETGEATIADNLIGTDITGGVALPTESTGSWSPQTRRC